MLWDKARLAHPQGLFIKSIPELGTVPQSVLSIGHPEASRPSSPRWHISASRPVLTTRSAPGIWIFPFVFRVAMPWLHIHSRQSKSSLSRGMVINEAGHETSGSRPLTNQFQISNTDPDLMMLSASRTPLAVAVAKE